MLPVKHERFVPYNGFEMAREINDEFRIDKKTRLIEPSSLQAFPPHEQSLRPRRKP